MPPVSALSICYPLTVRKCLFLSVVTLLFLCFVTIFEVTSRRRRAENRCFPDTMDRFVGSEHQQKSDFKKNCYSLTTANEPIIRSLRGGFGKTPAFPRILHRTWNKEEDIINLR